MGLMSGLKSMMISSKFQALAVFNFAILQNVVDMIFQITEVTKIKNCVIQRLFLVTWSYQKAVDWVTVLLMNLSKLFEPLHDKSKILAAPQQSLSSAWAYALSDQRHHCVF